MKTVNCILKYWVIQQCRITISWQLTPLWADDSTSRSNKIESPNLISWHRQNWIRIKSSSFYNMLADEKLNSLTKKSEINKIGCARSTWLDVTLIILMKEQLLWRIARGCSAGHTAVYKNRPFRRLYSGSYRWRAMAWRRGQTMGLWLWRWLWLKKPWRTMAYAIVCHRRATVANYGFATWQGGNAREQIQSAAIAL